jgi:hypothetical protein
MLETAFFGIEVYSNFRFMNSEKGAAIKVYLSSSGKHARIKIILSSRRLRNFINMTDLATPKEAIVLRPSQLQKLENLGVYYNSAEPAIICIKCSFAINPTRAPRHPGDKHHVPKPARRGLKSLICFLNLPNPETLPLRPDGSPPHPHLTVHKGSACKHCGLRSVSEKVLLTLVTNDQINSTKVDFIDPR